MAWGWRLSKSPSTRRASRPAPWSLATRAEGSAAAVRRHRDHQANRREDDCSHDHELPPAVHDLGGRVAEDPGDDEGDEAENEGPTLGAAADALRAARVCRPVVLVALVDGHVGHADILLASTR